MKNEGPEVQAPDSSRITAESVHRIMESEGAYKATESMRQTITEPKRRLRGGLVQNVQLCMK